MFHVTQNFTLGNRAYEVGEDIASDDVDLLLSNAHYMQFVVRIRPDTAPEKPAPKG